MEHKEVNVYPTKAKTKTDYFFHIIGTEVSYKYSIKEKKFQVIIGTTIIKEYKIPLTFEEFHFECKNALGIAIEKMWGLN